MTFKSIIRSIVELEDEIQSAPDAAIGTDWVEDRVRELRERYAELKVYWPVIPGNGNMRWRPFSPDWLEDT